MIKYNYTMLKIYFIVPTRYILNLFKDTRRNKIKYNMYIAAIRTNSSKIKYPAVFQYRIILM